MVATAGVTWGATTVFGTPAPPNAPTAAGTPAAAPGGSAFSFGAPAAAATLGTPTAPPPAPLFGAPAPAAGGFSAATPAGASASAPPAPLFGNTTVATPTTTFGAATSPAPPIFGASPTPSAYGTPTTALGATAYTPAAHHLTTARQESARLESQVHNLHASFSTVATDPLHPTSTALLGHPHPSSQCRFQCMFYDPLTPEQRQQLLVHGHVAKPAHVSASAWSEAVAKNPDPDRCAPVCVLGAKGLSARVSSQQEKAKVLAKGISQLRDTLEVLGTSGSRSEDALRYAAREQELLRKRLLGVMKKVEVCRCLNLPLQPGEREATERLRSVMRRVDAAGKMLGEAEERARVHASALRSGRAMVDGMLEAGELSEGEKQELFKVLDEQTVGMSRLADIVRRDKRDVGILGREVAKTGNGIGSDVGVGRVVGRGELSSTVGAFKSGGGMASGASHRR